MNTQGLRSGYSATSAITKASVTPPVNQAPIANAGADKSAFIGAALSFTGSASSDPDGSITSYSWNFGDGSSASGLNVSHGYNAAGAYEVQLTVTDNGGKTSSDMAVVTITSQGTAAPWTMRLGGSSGDQVLGTAIDHLGNVTIVGSFRGTANFGGASLTSLGEMDVFVAKYSASGTHLWSKRFGGNGDEVAQTVAVDNTGAVVVGGYFASASIDLGGGSRANAVTGVWDGFVAKYTSTGQHVWSTTFGNSNQDSVEGLTVDLSGNVVITGLFKGTGINFAGIELSSMWNGPDAFIVKLSGANGAGIWAKNIACGGPDLGNSVATDEQDNIFAVGQFFGTANFGGGALVTAGMNDVYLAKYTPAGELLWAKRFGAANDDLGASVTVDSSGNVAITGIFYGSVSFGGAVLVNPSNVASDIFVAKYTGDGTHIWSRGFGSGLPDYGAAIASDVDGNLLVTGNFSGTINFGGSPLTSANSSTSDMFVAEFSPTGAHQFSARYGSAGNELASSVAIGPNGGFMAGAFTGTVNFDGTNLVSAGMGDGFVFGLGR